jgi:predicted N-acyltransferase
MQTPLDVQVLGAVRDLGDDDWQAVTAGHGFYSSPRWLAFLEDDPWHDVWYVAVRDGATLLGVLPVYLRSGPGEAGADAFYDPATVFLAPAGVAGAEAWRPALLAGGRVGYETELLLRPGLTPERRREVLAAMTDRVARLAAAWGVDGTAFMYLTPEAADELSPVLDSRPLLADVSAAVPLAGCDTFDDYLGLLSGHRRRRIRHEMREFGRSGRTIRRAGLADNVEVLARLMAEHHGRYGLADDEKMLRIHLGAHAAHLGDLAQVLLCCDGRTVVGGLLAYEWDGTWYARAVGLADGLRGAYFDLVYYEPIRLAVERGITRYVVGPGTLDAKLNRGASLEPRWSLLTGSPRVASSLRTLSAVWNDRQIAHWQQRLGQLGHELPS